MRDGREGDRFRCLHEERHRACYLCRSTLDVSAPETAANRGVLRRGAVLFATDFCSFVRGLSPMVRRPILEGMGSAFRNLKPVESGWHGHTQWRLTCYNGEQVYWMSPGAFQRSQRWAPWKQEKHKG
jgi:hypothetical protein